MTLYISNKGEVETAALYLLGASVKDESAVGFFGSGFKYAIAALLRHEVKFTIYAGLRPINIEVRQKTFRSECFNVIWIEGEQTSITTRTGPKWEIRDAIREFWSNAMDEGEESRELPPAPGRTTIAIEVTEEIEEMIANWELYFLPETGKIFECDLGEIHEQEIPSLYRRNVWITEDLEPQAIFTYNFYDFDLPESRKVSKFSAIRNTGKLLEQLTNVDICEKLIFHSKFKESFELKSLLSVYISQQSTFAKTVRAAFKRRYTHCGPEKYRDQYEKYVGPENKVFWTEEAIAHFLTELGCPSISALIKDRKPYDVKPWPIGVKQRVERRINELAAHGIDLRPYARTFGVFENSNIIAMADMQDRVLVLGAQAVSCDATALTKALVEEWTHLYHDVHDYTVAQQHVYLDLIAQLLDR